MEDLAKLTKEEEEILMLTEEIWITDLIVLKDTLKVIMKLRDGGYLIFKCGMFSFIERMMVRY